MNGKYSFHLSGQCRLCLVRDGTVPIFSDSGTIKIPLKQKISVCLSLEVSVDLNYMTLQNNALDTNLMCIRGPDP